VTERPIDYPEDLELSALQPQLVVGKLSQAIMSVEYISEEMVMEKITWKLKATVLEEHLRYIVYTEINIH
jgi:hypothetical protein